MESESKGKKKKTKGKTITASLYSKKILSLGIGQRLSI
jgi:hypothetical protein